MPIESNTAMIMAGVPEIHASLYRKIQFSVHDPVVMIEFDGGKKRLLIVRDIEMERAKLNARVTDVHCPADFAPAEGLSGDRATATAQAAAECLRRSGVQVVRGDRLLPLIYVEMIRLAGIAIEYDPDLGVSDRRQKTEEEITWLRESQKVTEAAVELVCRMIANATAASDGVLVAQGRRLSSEYLRLVVDQFFFGKRIYQPTGYYCRWPLGG